jgi:pantoate--beta-alanine ligase
MRIVHTLEEASAALESLPRPRGLVPTMGSLHEGHLSLARHARDETATAMATIFVNPKQFGPHEDFASYPRNLPRDLELLEQVGIDLVLTPEVDEMYPPGDQTIVSVQALTQKVEGASRPGHFDGVTTVVARLFNIMRPDHAYFGQKDAQQALVIRRMTYDLRFPIQIHVLPTVREADGLALSSRNAYLSADERRAATVLSSALERARAMVVDLKVQNAADVRNAMMAVLGAEPLAHPDYVSVASPESLDELTEMNGRALISLAVRIGRTRLIDNIVCDQHGLTTL